MALFRRAAGVLARGVARPTGLGAPAVRCMSSQGVNRTTGQRKTEQLRDMIRSSELEFIMEAHNGLSAKIVQEAGFKVRAWLCAREWANRACHARAVRCCNLGSRAFAADWRPLPLPAAQGIWGSGLSISAAMGVRDSNEASWTQVLEVLDFMCETTDIPILLDGDTGYGNFNNARRLINKLESRGVAGVCLEDKLFPKTNSLLEVRGCDVACAACARAVCLTMSCLRWLVTG